MLEKVERVTTDKVVAEKLKQWIVENDLNAGEKLPTEQQLSEELGVARHTLREGIKRLSQLGIVCSKVGSGIYISDVNFDNVAEYMLYLKQRGYISLEDLYVVRKTLECKVAELAAAAIDEEHMRLLQELVEQMDLSAHSRDFETYVMQDVAFHMTLAESTGNRLFSGIISALRQVFLEHMSSLDSATAENSSRQHREILKAMGEHNADLARQLMDEHLSDIQDTFLK